MGINAKLTETCPDDPPNLNASSIILFKMLITILNKDKRLHSPSMLTSNRYCYSLTLKEDAVFVRNSKISISENIYLIALINPDAKYAELSAMRCVY
jgi:hypothetical protein